MPLLSLPWLELARFRRSVITKLALVVVVVIPCLYGGLYLASNWSPTTRLGSLDAAVVNEDVAVQSTGSDGRTTTVDAGGQIVREVTTAGAAGFTWHEVSASTARKGLEDGDYAAVMTVPADFSADLVSSGGTDPRKAELAVTTDDADNYIVGNVASSLTTTLRDSLAATTTAQYLDNVYVGFNDLHARISSAADGAGTLADGARSADTGAEQLTVGLGDLDDGATTLAAGSAALSAGASRLADGTAQLSTGAASAASGAERLSGGLQQVRTATTDLPTQTRQLADGAAAVSTGAAQVAAGTARVAAAADGIDSAATGLTDVPGRLTALGDDLGTAADDLGTARAALGGDVLDQARAVAAAHPEDPAAARLLSDLQSVQTQLDPQLDRIGAGLAGAATSVTTAGTDLGTAARTLDAARGDIDGLSAGATQVAGGAAAVSTGADALAQAAPTLTGGIATAADGAQALAAGNRQLATGAASAAFGARDLSTGADRVDSGAQRLAAGATSARDGAAQLADGTAQLADGSTQLADGLRSGADAIPTYDDADRANRSVVAASPVQSLFTRAHAVSAYGEGLAPYFICLSLWIGGMITYMVLRAVSPRALATTASSWRAGLSGWLPGAGFAIVQAAALFATLHWFLDFSAADTGAAVAFAMLVGVVFTSIHQCFNALLGGIGRLVALVLLMLQLASAGGTYPVSTAGPFFEAISPYLPMTHAVAGLRRLIAEGMTGAVWLDVLTLLAFGALAIGVTLFACHRRRTWTITKLHPSLSL